MRNVSKEFKQYMKKGQPFLFKLNVLFSDGTTETIENDHLKGVKYQDNVSESGKFSIGGAIMNGFSCTILNFSKKFKDKKFDDALITVFCGLKLETKTEYVQIGVFVVDEATVSGNTISIAALDNLYKLDRLYEPTITFPAMVMAVFNDILTQCGVPTSVSSFPNSDLIVESSSDIEGVGCRELIRCIAQLSCSFAKADENGSLILDWFNLNTSSIGEIIDGGDFTNYGVGTLIDGGNFETYSGEMLSGGQFGDRDQVVHINKLKAESISTEDIIITGVEIKPTYDDATAILIGQEGYKIVMDENPFITTDEIAQKVLNVYSSKLVGFRFRPFTVTGPSDPTVQTCDTCLVVDSLGNLYKSVITSVSFSGTLYETFRCDAESKLTKSLNKTNYSVKVVQKTKEEMNKKITSYEREMERMEQLSNNALGFYFTKVATENEGMILYKHEKPTLAESQIIYKQTESVYLVSNDGGETWNSGWDKDGNATMNILSVIGLNAEWIKTGTISGVTFIFEEGRIANMEVLPNGLFLTSDTGYDNFVIKTPYSQIDYNMMGLTLSSDRKIDGIERKMKITMTPENELKVGVEDEFGVHLGYLRISYDDIGFPIINIVTSQYGEPAENIFINDMNVVRRLNQVDQNTSDIYAIKLRLGML